MNTKIIIVLLILLSGCIGTDQKETYHSSKSNETIVLHPDGVFTVTGPGNPQGASGNFKIDGEKLILIFKPFGNIIEAKLNSSGIFAADGESWVRT